ncbi:hypothetical protein [Pedobacter sp.]|uniref:hypothetical protein n=1 Tax=Pedobacter sp. TaxID=1411316 RepID=UPI003D7F4E39
MIKRKAVTALLMYFTIVFAACTNKDIKTNKDLQQEKGNTAAVEKDSLIPETVQNDADFAIITGYAAGKIKIDENSEDVIKMLGKPDSSDAAMQKMVAFWFDNQDDTRYSIAIFAARSTEDQEPPKVRQIRVTSPAYKTKTGIGVNSTLTNIRSAFDVQEVKFPLNANQVLHIWIDKEGIAFEIGKDQRCNAVIIYKKGDDPSSTYLPLR